MKTSFPEREKGLKKFRISLAHLDGDANDFAVQFIDKLEFGDFEAIDPIQPSKYIDEHGSDSSHVHHHSQAVLVSGQKVLKVEFLFEEFEEHFDALLASHLPILEKTESPRLRARSS